MRTIFYIVQKEFLQVFRNRMMLPIIFVIPVVQLLILSYAVTFEIKQIRLYVVDNDHSVSSRSLVQHFTFSPFYQIVGQGSDLEAGMEFLQHGKAHQIISMLPGFEKNLSSGHPAKVQVINDAINGSAASLMSAYTVSIISRYSKDIITSVNPDAGAAADVQWSFWFNPELDYKTYMVPGILVLLVTIIGMFLAGMNVVREKELGTIEQINVTPVKKYQFIAGKLIPFWIIALFELAVGLIFARLFFSIPILGNIFLIFLIASVYLLVVMGIGLFLSTVTNTQQQSMFLAWFILVVFILMSGLFTPVESMPQWARNLNVVNPIAYFIAMIRMVMLKGSGFQHISRDLGVLFIYGTTMLSLAVWRYRKTI